VECLDLSVDCWGLWGYLDYSDLLADYLGPLVRPDWWVGLDYWGLSVSEVYQVLDCLGLLVFQALVYQVYQVFQVRDCWGLWVYHVGYNFQFDLVDKGVVESLQQVEQ
jgi:hypothetical protein